jgi:hypothetical protein
MFFLRKNIIIFLGVEHDLLFTKKNQKIWEKYKKAP